MRDWAAAMKALNIPTQIHGRVLVREAANPSAVVVGFHGYMENAEIQMARLQEVAGDAPWTLISVQGLHRFYRGRTQDVIAGWMTRQDREAMIADNIAYADRAIEAAAPAGVPLFTTGFSQGVAMAFRAGVGGCRTANGIAAVGGDVPPELLADDAAPFGAVLLARGQEDDWYTAAKLDADVMALRSRGLPSLDTLTYQAAHEWNTEVSAAVRAFIRRHLTN